MPKSETVQWDDYGAKVANEIVDHKLEVLKRRREKADAWFKALTGALAFVGVTGAIALPAATDEVSDSLFWFLVVMYLVILLVGALTSFLIYQVSSDPLTPSGNDGVQLKHWHDSTKSNFDTNLSLAKGAAVTLAALMVVSALVFALEPRYDFRWGVPPWNTEEPESFWVATGAETGAAYCGKIVTVSETGQVGIVPQGSSENGTPIAITDYSTVKEVKSCP